MTGKANHGDNKPCCDLETHEDISLTIRLGLCFRRATSLLHDQVTPVIVL